MKTRNVGSSALAAAFGILIGTSCASVAQSSSDGTLIPVVTIQATDKLATWTGDPGTFTVFRSGNPLQSLNVYYCIGGSATNGVDYKAIGNFIQLPSGVLSNSIVIQPVNLGQSDIRTVTIKLCPSPLMTPVNYVIGSPDHATVFIAPGGTTNLPPLVEMVSPPDGSVFYTPVNLPLLAKAADDDGIVTNVEFFAGGMDLGRGQPVVLDPPGIGGIVGPVYFLLWSNVPPASYGLTAVATDNAGASTTSDAVNIAVLPGPPPITNLPPIVRIASPPGGSVFRAPINLPLFAFARDFDGFVTSVEFLDGATSLGLAHQVVNAATVVPPGSGLSLISPTNFWELTWSNAPAGAHVLTAAATDNSNAVTHSGPIVITILPPLPPPTNRPPIISIFASDPIAVEGTNCYPWVGLTNVNPTWSNWTTTNPPYCLFTNCGPNNAVFTVRRHGDTNDALTIAYSIGGTASNGVDYVALPGTVTLPAGQRSALINIVPLDDGPPDRSSTVILRILPDTNVAPAYLSGYPRAAAALILDPPFPRPAAVLLSDNCFHLTKSGPDGAWFRVEYTTNFLNWVDICTNQVIGGNIDFIDPDSPAFSRRFYRVIPETSPPPE